MLYPDSSIEVAEGALEEFIETTRVQAIYLNQIGAIAELSPGLGILRLLVEPTERVPEAARGLIERLQ